MAGTGDRSRLGLPLVVHLPRRGPGQLPAGLASDQAQAHVQAGGDSRRGQHPAVVHPPHVPSPVDGGEASLKVVAVAKTSNGPQQSSTSTSS
jgi:hypothetical protein